MKSKKRQKKRRITESAVTPAHSVFRSSNLDTVAISAKRIFLWEGVVNGRGRQGACEGQCERQKKAKQK